MRDPITALEWHPGPGAEELVRRRAQLQVLTRQLLERERGLAAYRNELAAFETRYRRALGTRYAHLDELAERLDETEASDPDPLGPDPDSDDPADRYPGQGLPGGQNWAWGEREPEKEPELRAPVGDDAKRLFRQLARLIHPDLASDAAERQRRTNLMVAANDAYEQGDVATLERLLADWHASPEAVAGRGALADLERTIRRIAQVEAGMTRIEDELAELEASAMGWLRRRVEKAAREGWDLLAHMVRELDRQISEAQQELERRIPLRSHG
ncbi:MAG TPA: J domain-containing protein [Actinomycetota bacterium]|nr:J domain-containing protein [Actinomycetota bacterium]